MADYEKPPLSNVDFLRDLGQRLAGKADQLEALRDRACESDIDSDVWQECQSISRGIWVEAEFAIREAHAEAKSR